MLRTILISTLIIPLFSFTLTSQTELIQNGNFGVPCCSGISWTSSPDFYYNINYSNWHSNPGYAYLANSSGNSGNNLSGVLSQNLSTIPSNINSGTISFWYSVSTSETTTTTVFDAVDVGVWINSFFHNLGTISNLDNTNGSYSYFTANLSSSFINALNSTSTAQFQFVGYTDGASPSTFRVDDVSLLVNTSGGGGGNADAAIYSLSIDPVSGLTNPLVGENVDLEVEITNIGSSDLTSAFDITYTINGAFVDDDPVDGSDIPFPPGAIEYEYENNYVFTSPGTYQYCVTIDNHPDETNFSNNYQCMSITVVDPCTAIVISQQPSDQTITTGNTATFSVGATGTLPISYQWKKNNVAISGATNSSYTTPALSILDNGDLFKCELTNCNGTITSNQALLTVNNSTPNLTVQVTSPNGGETYDVGDNTSITANISGAITGKQIEYSIDNGNTWIFVWGTSNSNTSLSHNWNVPNTPSNNCLIRITVLYNGGSIEDISDGVFEITVPNSSVAFELNDQLSHIFWPYPSSNWTVNPLDSGRDKWRSVAENVGSPQFGLNWHTGAEYYAQDWHNSQININPSVNFDNDCNKDFNSPISGTIIFQKDGANHQCVGSGVTSNANSVIVQSDVDPNYAFKILHLNAVTVSEGDPVNVGDKLGEIGSTGSPSSHAHCVLFKNLTNYSYPVGLGGAMMTGAEILGEYGGMNSTATISAFSANFKFDATYLGPGGSVYPPIITNSSIILCQGDSITLTAQSGSTYSWNNGYTTQSIVIYNPGEYSVIVYDNSNQIIQSSSVIINQPSSDPIQIEIDPVFLCENESVVLSTNHLSINPLSEGELNSLDTYSWSVGSSNPYIEVTTPGTYWVEFNDAFGCTSSTDTIIISQYASPPTPIIQVNGNQLASNSTSGSTFNWYLFGDSIPNATTQFHTATQEGYYTVLVTNQNGCSTLSDPVFISGAVLAVEEFFNANIEIYPNPTSGLISIDASGKMEILNIEVYNSIGKCVWRDFSSDSEQSEISIDLSNLSKSVYFVKIETSLGLVVRKIILNE